MKFILSFVLITSSAIAFAQPQVIKQAIVTTTTNVVAPETEDVQNIQNQGGGNQMFRNFGDGETKSTTYLKDDMVKTVLKNDMGRSTIIRDNGKKLTTTLLEIMGNKTGFYLTDTERDSMKVKIDSMMKARSSKDTSHKQSSVRNGDNNYPVQLSYVEGTKKIAGYNCKKVLVITTRLLGIKDTVAVWYTPDIKLQNIASTGGTSSFSGIGSFGNFSVLNGLDKIDGFVMQYEMNMRRGRKMFVEVTKIELQKELAAKDFDVPKDFDVKPMKEFQGMLQASGMGQQFRPDRQ